MLLSEILHVSASAVLNRFFVLQKELNIPKMRLGSAERIHPRHCVRPGNEFEGDLPVADLNNQAISERGYVLVLL